MKFKELKEDIASGKSKIYLLEGDESYFLDRGVALITDLISEKTLNVSSFEGKKVISSPDDFISACVAYPFLSEKRLVRVNDFYPSEKEYEKVSSVFENPIESTIILIVNGGKNKLSGADLKKKPNVTFVDCKKADEEDVIKWAYITLKRAGVQANTDVCSALAAYTNYSMSRVASETEKIISYFPDGGVLDYAILDELVTRDNDYKMYELTSAVARKNDTRFASIMYDLFEKGYDEMSFLNALANYYKSLYDSFMSPFSDAETAKRLALKEYAVKKNREQASIIGKKKLKEYIALFYGAVADIKSGVLSPENALNTVTAEIFFDR